MLTTAGVPTFHLTKEIKGTQSTEKHSLPHVSPTEPSSSILSAHTSSTGSGNQVRDTAICCHLQHPRGFFLGTSTPAKSGFLTAPLKRISELLVTKEVDFIKKRFRHRFKHEVHRKNESRKEWDILKPGWGLKGRCTAVSWWKLHSILVVLKLNV